MASCMRDREQHDAADNWWYAEKCQCWAFLFSPGGESRSSHRCNDLHGAKWNVEEDCMEAVESESFHDQRTKSRDAAGGNSGTY